ncbi:MAG: hypothetical protein RBS19_00355 [Bacteroidales bacterium]|nr:hypothetical protein [Bacteroidales bacterium]
MDEIIRFSVYAPIPRQVVVVEYYLSGHIKALHFNDNAKGGFVRGSIIDIPLHINYVPKAKQIEFRAIAVAGCEVKDITNLELSFEKFWNVFAVKRGNIDRTKKLWAKISDAEKIIALGFINKLKAVYEKEGKQMPYPETYLSQKRWENEL